MPDVVRGDFEWDSSKAMTNKAKHGVTHHAKKGMHGRRHGAKLPAAAKQDAWRRKGQAKGQP